jgi:2-polyprenyl-3-methyl-5-hydroxy-6-metoxy-1,4-benzoquinol methylase
MSEPGLPANVRIVSELPAAHAEYSVADSEVMAALSRAEDGHFWHLSRNRFIARQLRCLGVMPRARILELGCGGGCVAAALTRAGFRITGVEGHLSRIRQAAARAPGANFLVHDLRLGLEPLGTERWDVVALFDVLEHLEDPAAALRLALRCVVPGGLLVGTVPALMSLWSDVDVRSGHRLRYDRRALASLLGELSDAEVLEVTFFNRLLVPLLWVQRRAAARPDALERGLKIPWAPVNALIDGALWMEQRTAPLLDRLRIPGASLWFSVLNRSHVGASEKNRAD